MESEIQIRDDHIHPQSCELICNIYNFMSKEAVLEEPSIPFRAVRKRVAQATAMPRSRIYRIISDLKRIRDGNPSHYIHKKRRKPSPLSNQGELEKSMIRRIYFELIMDKKTPISRVPVYNLYKDVVRYQGSSGAFLTLLKKIGFRLGRMTSGQMYLAEQHKIKKSRLDYLFSMKKIRDEKCNIIYLSAVNLLPYVPNWNSHKKLKENLNIPLNELRVARAVEFEVITAMDEARLISGNCLLFVSYNLNGKIKYHISFSQFTKWMSTNVLPKVSGNSVFVISHNLYKYFQGEKVPPLYSTRSQMEDWLSSHNIFFESNSLKTDLYDKILSVKDRYTTNLIDDFLIENKFRIISFPLHHCDLSPVETLLALFKIRFEESKETCSKVAELVTIFLDFLKTFLQDKWVASCENAKKYEEFFLSRESLIDNIIDEYISNKIFCREANEDTSSDDSSSNEN